jgi:peptide/nickel transport system substrate-binding protein
MCVGFAFLPNGTPYPTTRRPNNEECTEGGEALSGEVDRRSFLKQTGLTMAGLGVVGLPGFLAACGGSSKPSKASTATGGATTAAVTKPIDTLTIPFLADMQVPDPDIFYEGEGLMVTLSVYEGLVNYAPVPADQMLTYQPVAKRIAPGLAESWEVSADGLRYTFHLRSGVKFHDGTTMDAASWQKSFVRRAAVNQGPAYQVVPVASTAAPDPLTFVVTLKHPVDPFLDYMACPWSPKAVSPALVSAHTVGTDLAQKWLASNDAGTGPFKITEFVPADHYTLEAFDGYWGGPSDVKKVTIPIIPDVQTQELKLKTGAVDMLTKGLPIQDIQSFEKDPKFSVHKFGIALATAVFFNDTKGRLFANQELRQAVRSAINRKTLVSSVYKDTATPATQFFPAGSFPDGAAADIPSYDPSILTNLAKTLPSKKVDLAYGAQGGATNRLMAELVQTELQAAGLNVTTRAIPTSVEFALYNTPDSQRPDILLDLYGGDTVHVDTMLRIIFRTGAAPLNWFDYSFPAVDHEMDLASASTNQADSISHYAAGANIVKDAGVLFSIANQEDVVVARAGITNFVHDPMLLQMVRLHELKHG